MMSFMSYYGHVQNTSHMGEGESITTSHLAGASSEVERRVLQ